MNLDAIIIDRNDKQKAARVDSLREELKGMGYSVVRSSYLSALMFQAKRLKRMEEVQ